MLSSALCTHVLPLRYEELHARTKHLVTLQLRTSIFRSFKQSTNLRLETYVSGTKISQLIIFEETISVYSENVSKT